MNVLLFYEMTEMYVFCYYITCIHFRITGYLNFGCDMEEDIWYAQQFIPAHKLYASLGIIKSSVILKSHIITGCDMTNKLGATDVALKACPEFYCQSLDEKEFVSKEEIRLAEQYLIKLLYSNSKCVNLSIIYELNVIYMKTWRFLAKKREVYYVRYDCKSTCKGRWKCIRYDLECTEFNLC